tara:strand:+ start:6872 stop:7486 length:615 start_codon:yes stop_codon:yes gene_type:complete
MRLRSLAIQLSKLEQLSNQKSELEQYQTEGEIAARWLFDILAFNDLFEDCRVIDLGSGNGILGIGAVLLGAESASLVEVDEYACSICRKNVESLGIEDKVSVINSSINDSIQFLESPNLVISNPPWGRQKMGADRPFLESIIKIGVNAHLMHSAEAAHIEGFFKRNGWPSEKYGEFDFAIPASYKHHTRERGRTRASLWRITPP